LGRRDIPVPEHILDGPDVVAHFEQVRCERMPQGVRIQRLEDARAKSRRLQSTRQDGIVEVMVALDAIGPPQTAQNKTGAQAGCLILTC
jgi:hypothetical protein